MLDSITVERHSVIYRRKTGKNTKNTQSMLCLQGADLAGEGRRGQDPSPAGRQQVGPGGA